MHSLALSTRGPGRFSASSYVRPPWGEERFFLILKCKLQIIFWRSLEKFLLSLSSPPPNCWSKSSVQSSLNISLSLSPQIIIEGLGRLLLVRQNIPLVDEDKLKKILEASSTSPCHHGKGRLIPNMRYNKFQTEDMSQPYGMMEITSDESPLMSRYGQTKLEWEVHEIKRFIRLYLNRQKDKERKNLVAMEWRTLALILDRTFFCLYTIAISVAIIVLLPRSGMAWSACFLWRWNHFRLLSFSFLHPFAAPLFSALSVFLDQKSVAMSVSVIFFRCNQMWLVWWFFHKQKVRCTSR